MFHITYEHTCLKWLNSHALHYSGSLPDGYARAIYAGSMEGKPRSVKSRLRPMPLHGAHREARSASLALLPEAQIKAARFRSQTEAKRAAAHGAFYDCRTSAAQFNVHLEKRKFQGEFRATRRLDETPECNQD
jgi:hypothetical protein